MFVVLDQFHTETFCRWGITSKCNQFFANKLSRCFRVKCWFYNQQSSNKLMCNMKQQKVSGLYPSPCQTHDITGKPCQYCRNDNFSNFSIFLMILSFTYILRCACTKCAPWLGVPTAIWMSALWTQWVRSGNAVTAQWGLLGRHEDAVGTQWGRIWSPLERHHILRECYEGIKK